jgi:hypothetical protein
MTCHEVAFARALCRIEVFGGGMTTDMPAFTARMWLIDDDHAKHPLVDGGRRALEIHASSEALAISSATTFLESQFGPLCEYAHQCQDFGDALDSADPFVIKDLP